MLGGIPSLSRAGGLHFRVRTDGRAGVRGLRPKARFLWPQLVHRPRSPNNRWKGEGGSSATATNSPRSPKSRPSRACSVSAATRRQVRLRKGDGARAKGGGGVLVLAARRPFQSRSSEICFLPFLPPSYSPSQPRISLPPFLLSASLFSTAAPGPGHFPGRAHYSARPRGPVYDRLSCYPSLPPPHVAAGPRRRCPLWLGKQLAGSGKHLSLQELGATLRARSLAGITRFTREKDFPQ